MDPRDASASKNIQMDDLTTIRLGGVDENYLWRSVRSSLLEHPTRRQIFANTGMHM